MREAAASQGTHSIPPPPQVAIETTATATVFLFLSLFLFLFLFFFFFFFFFFSSILLHSATSAFQVYLVSSSLKRGMSMGVAPPDATS